MIKIVKGTHSNGRCIEYNIVNEKGDVILFVDHYSHMEWILSGDYAELEPEENYLHVQEDVYYDIDDKKFVESVKRYISRIGYIINYDEMRAKCSKYALVDYENMRNYASLSLSAKLVFLFEAVVSKLHG